MSIENRQESKARSETISAFRSLGITVAVVISWSLNHSVGWAILHGVFGWLYLLYYWIFL